MNSGYEMTVMVRGYGDDKEYVIIDAWDEVWPPDPDVSLYGEALRTELSDDKGVPILKVLPTYGQLPDGETEREFAEKATKAIWEANGGYCKVEITSMYLDDPPVETFEFDDEDYIRFAQEDRGGL